MSNKWLQRDNSPTTQMPSVFANTRRGQAAVVRSVRPVSKKVFSVLIVTAILVALTSSTNRQVTAQTTSQWNTAFPFWQNFASWSPLGVPGSTDIALFDIDAIDTVIWNATTGNRSAAKLDVIAGNYTFDNVTETPFQLNLGAISFSPLRVIGVTTTVNLNGLHINLTASNALVENGATLNIGTGSGGVLGQITSTSFFRNNGTLNVLNGATVTNTSGSIASAPFTAGAATISGMGSTWNNSVLFTVGDGGFGTLNVVDGGVVSCNSTTATSVIGFSGSSTGTANVTGAGSQWNISNELEIGRFGTGNLNVENGGTVSTAVASCIAVNALSTGTATVKDIGSSWTSESLCVGQSGVGTLNVENGGSVELGNLLVVGDESGSTGVVNVSGNDAHIDTPELMVGREGNASMSIGNGAHLTCDQTTIGTEAGSSGFVTIGGAGSLLQNLGDILVGSTGIGDLAIEPGGSALVNGELTITPPSSVVVSNSFLLVNGGINNNGLLLLLEDANIAADVVNSATVRVSSNSDVLLAGNLFHAGAFIETSVEGRFRISGAAGGNGPYIGPGLVQFDGRFEPGVLGPGQISFAGNVALALDAALQIQLGGTATNLFDRLSINGSLAIDPQRPLEVALINGFAIAPGMKFVIAEVGTTRTGQFAGLSGGGLVGNFGGTDLFISYAGGDGNDVALYTVGVLGDVNGDGVVSLLDVSAFVDALTSGSFIPEADINRDGVISLLDVSPFVALLTG